MFTDRCHLVYYGCGGCQCSVFTWPILGQQGAFSFKTGVSINSHYYLFPFLEIFIKKWPTPLPDQDLLPSVNLIIQNKKTKEMFVVENSRILVLLGLNISGNNG